MKTKNTLKCTIAIAALTVVASPGTLRSAIEGSERISSPSRRGDQTEVGRVQRISNLIGKEVRTSDDKKAGRLSNMAVDLESGRILYAIVNSGGDRVALPPGIFRESRGEDLRLTVSQNQLQGAPAFTDSGQNAKALGSAEFVNRVHKHFNQPAWWEGQPGTAGSGSFNNTYLVNELSGMRVRNVGDQEVGTIKNVLVSVPASRVMFVVLAPDRDLKLGSDNYYVLPPMALTRHSDGKTLVTDVSREKLAAAPKFDKDNWPDFSSRDWTGRVYSYYGKDASFSGTGLTPTGRESGRVWDDADRESKRSRDKADDISEDLRREMNKWDTDNR